MSTLELKSISKSYGKKQVLDNLNCTFEKGVYGLLGPNGAGKTTLISIIVNILNADSGEVLFGGKPVKVLGSDYYDDIGYLPQYPHFYSNYTAQEFLEYIAVIKGLTKKKAKQRIDELFEFVNLQDDKNKKVGAYSGDGFLIKTVGEKPCKSAQNVPATLEEVYLCYVSESGGEI